VFEKGEVLEMWNLATVKFPDNLERNKPGKVSSSQKGANHDDLFPQSFRGKKVEEDLPSWKRFLKKHESFFAGF
jgi:hypothetical protein